jgi:glutamyl-tRNA synthetase
MTPPSLPEGLRTRIAPTPSGLLHPGNGAAFVLTWKLARSAHGRILLRIDDLDRERVRPEHVDDIFRTLEWLRIDWDEGPESPDDLQSTWSQVHKLERYQERVEALRDTGALYACTCTRTSLGSCTCRDQSLSFDTPDVTWRLDLRKAPAAHMHCWPGPDLELTPGVLMPQDPVIRQREGRAAYQLASLVDDLDQAIDFIVRGKDLLPSTACQLELARALGEPTFGATTFVHHGLLTDGAGEKLSKSQGAGSLKAMRDQGVGPGMVHDLADRLLEDLLSVAQA